MSVLFSFMLALATFLFFPNPKYSIQFAVSLDSTSYCQCCLIKSFTLQTYFLTVPSTLKSFIDFYYCHQYALTFSLKVVPIYFRLHQFSFPFSIRLVPD